MITINELLIVDNDDKIGSVNDTFPPPIRLYALEPLHMGTPYIQGLSSYVVRLATEHCVTVGRLFSKEISPLLSIPRQNYNGHFCINGSGSSAQDWVDTISELTKRDDIHLMSMVRWSNVIEANARSRQFRRNKYWCPDCIFNWRESSQVSYEPLIWNFEPVKICILHRRRLAYSCPICFNSITILTGNISTCNHCGSWLGKDPRQSNISDEEYYIQQWIINVVSQLFNIHMDTIPIRSNIMDFILRVANEHFGGIIAKLARYLYLPVDTLMGICKGRRIPSLQLSLWICFRLRVTLLDIFTNNRSNITMGENDDIKLMNYFICKESTVKLHKDELERRLLDLLKQSKGELSLQKSASKLGSSPRHLMRQFPDLCNKVVSEHKQYVKERRESYYQEKFKLIEEGIIDLYEQGAPITPERLQKHISSPKLLLNHRFKEKYHEVLERLGV